MSMEEKAVHGEKKVKAYLLVFGIAALIMAIVLGFSAYRDYSIERADILQEFVGSHSPESLPGGLGNIGLTGETQQIMVQLTNYAVTMMERMGEGKEGPINVVNQVAGVQKDLTGLAEGLSGATDSRVTQLGTAAVSVGKDLTEVLGMALNGEDWSAERDTMLQTLNMGFDPNLEALDLIFKLVAMAVFAAAAIVMFALLRSVRGEHLVPEGLPEGTGVGGALEGGDMPDEAGSEAESEAEGEGDLPDSTSDSGEA